MGLGIYKNLIDMWSIVFRSRMVGRDRDGFESRGRELMDWRADSKSDTIKNESDEGLFLMWSIAAKMAVCSG